MSHFGFKGWTLVLIASVPSHCLPVTFHGPSIGIKMHDMFKGLCVCVFSEMEVLESTYTYFFKAILQKTFNYKNKIPANATFRLKLKHAA